MNAKTYIARSALASFLLEVSQSYEPGITGLVVEFVDPTLKKHLCSCVVLSVDHGTADPFSACCVVADVERPSSGWVMVEDGSPLDRQTIDRPSLLH